MTEASTVDVRHPLDPDPVRSTKAGAVLALGVLATITGFFIGGLIPATLALLLARQARSELAEAKGFLLGAGRIRWGVGLAWAGIVLAATALVIASIIGLLHLADASGARRFGPNVN